MELIVQLADEEAATTVLASVDRPADHVYRMGVDYTDEEWQTLFACALRVLKVGPGVGVGRERKTGRKSP